MSVRTVRSRGVVLPPSRGTNRRKKPPQPAGHVTGVGLRRLQRQLNEPAGPLVAVEVAASGDYLVKLCR